MTVEILTENDKLTAKLVGRLDTLASSQFARDIEPLMDNADKCIVLDCSALEFISSSGLRLFLALRKQTIALGGEVIITGVSNEIKQVFTITGFVSLFKFE